jgi:hypothetical protein
MIALITLVLAVAVLLVVLALARLTRLIVSIKARLDALERSSRRTPGAEGDPPIPREPAERSRVASVFC